MSDGYELGIIIPRVSAEEFFKTFAESFSRVRDFEQGASPITGDTGDLSECVVKPLYCMANQVRLADRCIAAAKKMLEFVDSDQAEVMKEKITALCILQAYFLNDVESINTIADQAEMSVDDSSTEPKRAEHQNDGNDPNDNIRDVGCTRGVDSNRNANDEDRQAKQS